MPANGSALLKCYLYPLVYATDLFFNWVCYFRVDFLSEEEKMSKCCNAEARAYTTDLTGYYTCLKCGCPCDLKSFWVDEGSEGKKAAENAWDVV